MMTYDAKLHAISLHTFTTFEKTVECSRETAKRQDILFGDIVDVIFASIPSDLGLFSIYIQDTLAYGKKIIGMMDKADMKTGLYLLRIFARSQSSDKIIVKLYDAFIKKYTEQFDSFRAWNAIETGIAERYIIYDEDPLMVTGDSLIFKTCEASLGSLRDFKTIQQVVAVFHTEGKYWIQQYSPPPSYIGTRFLSTVLMAHFGYLIQHDKSIDIDRWIRDPLFKKQRALKSKKDIKEAVLQLVAAAVGIYAKRPEDFADIFVDYPRADELIEEYQVYRASTLPPTG